MGYRQKIKNNTLESELKKTSELNKEISSDFASDLQTGDGLTHRELFLDNQNNCPLCGSELTQSHVTHFIELVVQEEAQCDSCKVQVRKEAHTLQ